MQYRLSNQESHLPQIPLLFVSDPSRCIQYEKGTIVLAIRDSDLIKSTLVEPYQMA